MSSRAEFDRACREQHARNLQWLAEQPLRTRMKMWPANALVAVTQLLVLASPVIILVAALLLAAWLLGG